jgi:hypothetical protein
MAHTQLLFLLLIPVALSLVSYPILVKYMDDRQGALIFSIGGIFVSALILTAALYGGAAYKMADSEVWNGQVTSKERKHDTYEQSYECMCSTDSKGNRSCQTCYETHYTVEWTAHTDLEDFRIDKEDSTSRAVYMSPDPAFYKGILKGDPVAVKRHYKNYIKAVPESILRPRDDMSQLRAKYAGSIPAYPLGIYDFYNLDRVVTVGVTIPNLREWNRALARKLNELGPMYQANIVLVITKFDDPNYFYALQEAWLNGKKNDIVIVVGAPEFPAKASWVNIMALTKTDLFQVQLRDALLDLDGLTMTNVLDTIDQQVKKNFKRRSMKEFQYLEAEIDAPAWIVGTAVGSIIAAYIAFWVYTMNATNHFFLRLIGRRQKGYLDSRIRRANQMIYGNRRF